MDYKDQLQTYEDNAFDFKEIFSALWAAKKLLFCVTAISGFVAVIIALSIPNHYKASALLAPVEYSPSRISGALGNLGGLAALAGVNLDSGSAEESDIAMEILTSWGFLSEFIDNNEIAVEVFAALGWDKAQNQLILDKRIYDENSNVWKKGSISDGSIKPSSWDLYKKIKEMISVYQDNSTGLVTISVEYFSPYLAKDWTDKLVAAINNHMQQRKLEMVNTNIQYLEAQVAKTDIEEIREVVYTIIEEQIKSKMLAEANPDYVFLTISPAMVPENKSRPKRFLIFIVGIYLGLFFSIMYVLFKDGDSSRFRKRLIYKR